MRTSTAPSASKHRSARSKSLAGGALLLLLASCAALSPGQADRDRVYRDIEEGRLTASEASQQDREPTPDWIEMLALGLALVGPPGSVATVNLLRNRKRRMRGEPVVVPDVVKAA